MSLSNEQRADLSTARETLLLADSGTDNVDFVTAAAMIDRVLATACSHSQARHYTTSDETTGRPLTTCPECGVSWYADFADRLRHLT